VLRTVWRGAPSRAFTKFLNLTTSLSSRGRPRATQKTTSARWYRVGGVPRRRLKERGRWTTLFASFKTPDGIRTSHGEIRDYAAGYGRANAQIESGLIMLCRSRRRASAISRKNASDAERHGSRRGGLSRTHRVRFPTKLSGRGSVNMLRRVSTSCTEAIAEHDAWPKQTNWSARKFASKYAAS